MENLSINRNKKEFNCPACGKPIERMWDYKREDGSTIGVFHCGCCIDGIDSDWEITYAENVIEKIERYFFG